MDDEPPEVGLEKPSWWVRRDSVRRLLLVCLALIGGSVALLQMLGLSSVGHGHRSPWLTKDHLTSIERAITAFYNEYGYMPDPWGGLSPVDARVDTSDPVGQALLNILLGRESGPVMQNPKQIAFLTLPTGTKKKGGLVFDAHGKVKGAFDAWGRGYQVLIDYDGDETLSPPSDSGRSSPLHRCRAAGYSLGPDGTGGRNAIRCW
ncbi:hypothetical protein [Luteolibacter sp. LG18]|uniref:hypothetical protein n=1 Tax=Luteolibacter sp. LG18 TaxID=2819286 RepID=UPI002B29B715|nr:hypothetical protein llg_19840 [Luteolibacter sp. LG18]